MVLVLERFCVLLNQRQEYSLRQMLGIIVKEFMGEIHEQEAGILKIWADLTINKYFLMNYLLLSTDCDSNNDQIYLIKSI